MRNPLHANTSIPAKPTQRVVPADQSLPNIPAANAGTYRKNHHAKVQQITLPTTQISAFANCLRLYRPIMSPGDIS